MTLRAFKDTIIDIYRYLMFWNGQWYCWFGSLSIYD